VVNSTFDSRQCIVEYRVGLQRMLDALPVDEIEKVIGLLHKAYEQGKQVFIIGNGGSAATASHMACDLAKTTLGKTPHAPPRRFRVIALTDNVPLITAWGNDAHYQLIFAEQLRNLASPGDLLIAITGSGNSPNIVEAVKAAQELGVKSAGLLGFDGGVVRELLDEAIVIESDNYGYIEDLHLILNHLITHFFKQVVAESNLVLA
jgi:D-sedoheptulose 7-phosphate isomerase